jgi:type IV pilus assembly protein PilP
MRASHLLTLAAFGLLQGCGDGGLQEVKQWMAEVKNQTPVKVEKLSPPKTFTPFTYAAKDEPDPYSPAKLSAALAKLQAASSSPIKPDLERRREPLESYPLDSVKMVGTLQKPGMSYAVLQVDKAVFQIKVGNYIGQNFGIVTRIGEAEVELKEVVRDAAGEWTERKAKLELQENKQ